MSSMPFECCGFYCGQITKFLNVFTWLPRSFPSLANTILSQFTYLLPPCILKWLFELCLEILLNTFRTMYKVQLFLHLSDVLCFLQAEPRFPEHEWSWWLQDFPKDVMADRDWILSFYEIMNSVAVQTCQQSDCYSCIPHNCPSSEAPYLLILTV